MHSKTRSFFISVALFLSVFVLAGCDLGTYGQRLEANGPNYKYDASPAKAKPAADSAGTEAAQPGD